MEKAHRLVRSSGFVQTEPVGYKEQPPFTNGAWLIETRMMLSELTEWLHILEDRLGRVRTENRFGPRTIDLDLVVWNGEIVDEDVFERDFLNKAVLEVLPGIAEQM